MQSMLASCKKKELPPDNDRYVRPHQRSCQCCSCSSLCSRADGQASPVRP